MINLSSQAKDADIHCDDSCRQESWQCLISRCLDEKARGQSSVLLEFLAGAMAVEAYIKTCREHENESPVGPTINNIDGLGLNRRGSGSSCGGASGPAESISPGGLITSQDKGQGQDFLRQFHPGYHYFPHTSIIIFIYSVF
jgi:hypothetical protein